jgi:LuxR family transcriptional regulator, maltose regulon positive regulatory protein
MTTLLATKFHIPPLRIGGVRRPHLASLVGQQALTLISAPAGYGKTTLAAECLRQQPENRRAWLTLDEGDNDPVRFIRYLTAALKPTLPHLSKLGEVPEVRDQLDVLINALTGLSKPVWLVLDDYQVIETQAVHQTFSYLINHRPPNLHLILTTRIDPPLPLARLRARHQLQEIRVKHLKFSADETLRFMTRTLGLSISATLAATLEKRTEGWAAGLQLAALSLQSGADISKIVGTQILGTKIMGTHHPIADYLLAEVYKQQPASVQNFLLRTSILQRLSAPLCAALTKSETQAQAMLERLERQNLFLIALDNDRHWYRYHPLFAEFLQQRLQTSQPQLTNSLHQRASQWLAKNDYVSEALDHLLAASDFKAALPLLDTAAVQWIQQGEFTTLLTKLAALPQSFVIQNAELCIWQAWALVLSDHFEGVEFWLKPAEAYYLKLHQRAQTETALREELLWDYKAGYGQTTAIRATLALLQQNYTAAQQLAEQALSLLHRNDLVLPSAMALNLGQAYLAQGQVAKAIPWLQQARTDSRSVGHSFIYLNALLGLTRAEHLQGHLKQAKAFAAEAEQFIKTHPLPSLVRLVQEAQAIFTHPPSTALDPLNARELEILRLLEQGLSNQAIADELIVAVSTVRWHIKHIYRKLGVHNRAQAAHRARELGLA